MGTGVGGRMSGLRRHWIREVFDPAAERVKPRLKVVMPKEAKVRRGRPPAAAKEDTLTAKEPWRAEGLSRGAWYAKHKERL